MYILFIADDHRLFVDGLRFIIGYATDYKLAGVVHNGNDVVPFLQKQPVDILLLDMDLPGKYGVWHDWVWSKLFKNWPLLSIKRVRCR